MKRDDKETAFHHMWRPAVAWAFIIIILFDFVIAPGIVLAMIKAGIAISPWTPLTMDGVGTFYLAMGAILGVTSWQRGQEQVERVKRGYDFGRNDSEDPIDPGPPL
jgi:hypothetical protein